ncbi:MAG: DUF2961 domain-containing protein [Lewinella sp.]|nr:DUF2961 domain-containing protein [Lewinella sp.]
MKYFYIFLFHIASIGLYAQNPILSWESLPRIRDGVKIRAFTSYNPTGRTFRDFRNYTLQDETGFEMADFRGERGMLTGIWFTSLGDGDVRFGPGCFGDIKLWFDDPEYPAITQQRDVLFYWSRFPNLHPLWGTAGGAQWAFPCLPFDRLFRAASTQAPHWYQFTAHLYRTAASSEAIPPAQLAVVNDKLKDYVGKYPGSLPANQAQEGRLEVDPGKTVSIFEQSGNGVIHAIRIRPASISNAVVDKVFLKLSVDKETAPSAYVPLSVFFGGYEAAPMSNAKGLPCGFDGEWLYFFFPIPYWENCRIELENRSQQAVSLTQRIEWVDHEEVPRKEAGQFRIQYNDGITRKAGEPDFPHLAVKGSGHVVGVSANLAGSIEGNFRVYIDDSRTPAIETTGGEDYFCNAFGIDIGLVTPFHGGLNDKVGYRFHIIDYIPFQSSIILGQDHGHSYAHDTDGTFRSAVFYYLNPTPRLVLSDSLDVGSLYSEKSHAFAFAGKRHRLQTDTAAYEGNFIKPFADAGRWTEGEFSFRMKIDPANDGIRLRRCINQLAFHQEVEVFVDGQPAGLWFEQGSNYHLLKEENPEAYPEYNPDWKSIPNRFRDTDFEIDPGMTQGKNSIMIRLVAKGSMSAVSAMDEGLINAYSLSAYSYIHP